MGRLYIINISYLQSVKDKLISYLYSNNFNVKNQFFIKIRFNLIRHGLIDLLVHAIYILNCILINY